MKVLETEKNRILSTVDYAIFKYEPKARFYQKRLQNLIEEMSIKNLSKDIPIIVDAEYNILDGVYRFEANKSLESPVYYKVAQVSNKLDLMKAQTLRYAPSDYEFLLFHQDKLAYRKVLEWEKNLPYSYKDIICVFSKPYLNKKSHPLYRMFKNGEMEYAKGDDFKLSQIKEFVDVFNASEDHPLFGISFLCRIMADNSWSPKGAIEEVINLPYFNDFIKLNNLGHPGMQSIDKWYWEAVNFTPLEDNVMDVTEKFYYEGVEISGGELKYPILAAISKFNQ